MWTAQSPGSRATTGQRSHVEPPPLTADFNKFLTKSSPRFGTLSHHSFFSRHNPHPNRVRHIQDERHTASLVEKWVSSLRLLPLVSAGSWAAVISAGLNGRPICTVRDDWFVTTSLYPHPLLKSHVLRKEAQPSFPWPHTLYGVGGNKTKSALFSEAWRDELKELAAKVSLSSQAQKEKKEDPPEEEFIRRKTQYSAATGRIIPPSNKSSRRKTFSQHLKYPLPFQDQELTVLEVLCQILQTDSLSAVQQWLLLAGQREKDLVMGMITQALDGVDLSGRHQPPAFHPGASPPAYVSSLHQRTRASSRHLDQTFSKPERIGDAEVLEVHTEAKKPLEKPAVVHTCSA